MLDVIKREVSRSTLHPVLGFFFAWNYGGSFEWIKTGSDAVYNMCKKHSWLINISDHDSNAFVSQYLTSNIIPDIIRHQGRAHKLVSSNWFCGHKTKSMQTMEEGK